ncbi:hypothetical protein AB0P40_02140 [Streptomyces sp. NPDC079189]
MSHPAAASLTPVKTRDTASPECQTTLAAIRRKTPGTVDTRAV